MSQSKPPSEVTTQGYPTKFWKQGDGTLIAVAAMSDGHIYHTIELIKRRNVQHKAAGMKPWRTHYLPRLIAEQEYRKRLRDRLTVTSR